MNMQSNTNANIQLPQMTAGGANVSPSSGSTPHILPSLPTSTSSASSGPPYGYPQPAHPPFSASGTGPASLLPLTNVSYSTQPPTLPLPQIVYQVTSPQQRQQTQQQTQQTQQQQQQQQQQTQQQQQQQEHHHRHHQQSTPQALPQQLAFVGAAPSAAAAAETGDRSPLVNEGEHVDSHGQLIGKSGKPLRNTKRAAQNRNAQKAFRQRRERYIKDLENKAKDYDRMASECGILQRENEALQNYVAKLQKRITDAGIKLDDPSRN